MTEQMMDRMSDCTLSPTDYITLMFERTDEDGILYIPGWHYTHPGWELHTPGSTDENDSYRCKINWNLAKYESIKAKFETLLAAIQELAKLYDDDYADDAQAILQTPDLARVWELYLEPFDVSALDINKVNEVYDKLDMIAIVKQTAQQIANGETLQDYQKELLIENIDVTVTEEERAYWHEYLNTVHKQAEQRLGNAICAHEVIIHARRLCKLFALGAPQIMINNEGKQLAAAFVLHEYGISRELVDNSVRLRLEQMELMSEDELDDLYRPQKTNTRKSLAPLFVFEILSKYSDTKTHLRQNEILKKLSAYPYEISLERKALSRIIHNLVDSPEYAVFQDKSGAWIDRQERRG